MNGNRNDPAAELREYMAACMQCGTCSASCPNAEFMDVSPRRLWRLAQLDRMDDVLASRTFWMCSSCYSCMLRCPRGLPTTRAMQALKRLAAQQGAAGARRGQAFCRAFTENVERYGRVQEGALMNTYLRRRANPALALSYVPLGWKLLRRGKLHLLPGSGHKGRLAPLVNKVREMEARS
ncbi:MAG: 4Fe-4S dicluster domain-containing protein [Desulfovibrio sp.]|nr:4Fe-4S dicluster domain-containing protein [Desulfovibrio sp.]